MDFLFNKFSFVYKKIKICYDDARSTIMIKLNLSCITHPNISKINLDYSHIDRLFVREESDNKGWLNLPYQDTSMIKEYVKSLNGVRNLVVVGIGGSMLGFKSILRAVGNKNNIQVHLLDTTDPYKISEVLDSIDLKRTLFNIISKSGKTVEVAAMLSVIESLLNSQNISLSKHIVITTGKDSALWQYAKIHSIKLFSIPEDVGGRFSALSYVGLLPACVVGIDIDKLCNGAQSVFENAKQHNKNNLALLTATMQYELMVSGRDELVIMPYSHRLEYMADFYSQLLAESLGKHKTKDNIDNKLSITPIKATGPRDQHSQLQLYMEGKDNKTILFIAQDYTYDIKTTVNDTCTTLGKLTNIELESTRLALYESNRPSFTLLTSETDEYSVGQIIAYFELNTAFLGLIMNVDAFNQPGVESGKAITHRLLTQDKSTTKALKKLEKSVSIK